MTTLLSQMIEMNEILTNEVYGWPKFDTNLWGWAVTELIEVVFVTIGVDVEVIVTFSVRWKYFSTTTFTSL